MRSVFTFLLLMSSVLAFAQPGKKPVEKPPTQSEMDKAMEEAMKGMSPGRKSRDAKDDERCDACRDGAEQQNG